MDNGIDVTSSVTDNGDGTYTYTITGVTVDHTVNVTFANNTYILTVNVTGSGTVTKSPDQSVYDYGTQVTLTATPATGYHFLNWTGDVPSGHETDNPLTVTMDSDKTITANFAINTYTITASAGTGGIVIPPTQTVNYGGNASVTITPDTGYHIKNVLIDGRSVTVTDPNNPFTYTFSNVTSNHTIEAQFEINANTFTFHIPTNWSIISVPFETDPSLLTSNANIQYLFYWDGNFWQIPTTLQSGIGYLVYNTSLSTIDITLTGTPTSSPFTEPATGNWQVIGNPFTTTCSLSSTSTITYFFYWDGNFWQTADPNNLQPGIGYLMLTNGTGILTFTENP